jgi:hypothetical protein
MTRENQRWLIFPSTICDGLDAVREAEFAGLLLEWNLLLSLKFAWTNRGSRALYRKRKEFMKS